MIIELLQQARPVAWKEWLQLRRDKPLMGFLIALPMAQMIVMGLAIQNEVKDLPTLVYLQDPNNPALEVVKTLQANETFDVILEDRSISSAQEAIQAVKRGKYRIGVIIPPQFSRKALQGERPPLNVVIDGTNANMTKSVVQALQSALRQPMGPNAALASDPKLKLTQVNGSSSGGLSGWFAALPELQILNNPELSAPLFLIPGIVGIIMHILTVLLSSFSLVRERESGTLEPLLVTPLKPLPLMVGKLFPYAVIGLIDMALALVLMLAVFSITVEGSFWFLAGSSVIFILASLALGLVFSIICRTQVQALQLTLGLLLPSLILSGFVFPIDPMPALIKVISYSLPLTYYLTIIRGVVIQGLGADQLWPNVVILAGFTVACLVFSTWRFRRVATA